MGLYVQNQPETGFRLTSWVAWTVLNMQISGFQLFSGRLRHFKVSAHLITINVN